MSIQQNMLTLARNLCIQQARECSIREPSRRYVLLHVPAERSDYELRRSAFCCTTLYVRYVGRTHIHNDLERAAELSN